MKAIISANAKGGTGKTVIAINLAIQLSKHGSVGILDADLDSSNLYEYMGLHGKMGLTEERKIIPLKHNGMEIFTMGGFLPDSDKGVSITGASMKQMLIDAVENVAEDKVSIQKQKLITETKINILEKVFPRRYGRYVTHDHTVELMSERIKRIRAEEEARLGGDKPGISAQKAIDIEPSPPHKQGEEEEQEKT